MTDSISQAPDEREAIVRWLRDEAMRCQRRADDGGRYGRYSEAAEHQSWAKHAELLANALQRGDHLPSEQGEG